jgi:hypothetical protein
MVGPLLEFEYGVDGGVGEAIGAKSDDFASVASKAVILEPDALITEWDTAAEAEDDGVLFSAIVAIGAFLYHEVLPACSRLLRYTSIIKGLPYDDNDVRSIWARRYSTRTREDKERLEGF